MSRHKRIQIVPAPLDGHEAALLAMTGAADIEQAKDCLQQRYFAPYSDKYRVEIPGDGLPESETPKDEALKYQTIAPLYQQLGFLTPVFPTLLRFDIGIIPAGSPLLLQQSLESLTAAMVPETLQIESLLLLSARRPLTGIEKWQLMQLDSTLRCADEAEMSAALLERMHALLPPVALVIADSASGGRFTTRDTILAAADILAPLQTLLIVTAQPFARYQVLRFANELDLLHPHTRSIQALATATVPSNGEMLGNTLTKTLYEQDIFLRAR